MKWINFIRTIIEMWFRKITTSRKMKGEYDVYSSAYTSIPTNGRNWSATRKHQKKFGAKSFSIWNRTFFFSQLAWIFLRFSVALFYWLLKTKKILNLRMWSLWKAFLRFQNFVCNKLGWRKWMVGVRKKNISALRRIEEMKCHMRTRVKNTRV